MDESVTSTNTQASSNDYVASEKPSVKVNDDGDGKSNNNAFLVGLKHAQAVIFIKKLIHFYLASHLPPAFSNLEISQRLIVSIVGFASQFPFSFPEYLLSYFVLFSPCLNFRAN